jgi:hypothetical protein
MLVWAFKRREQDAFLDVVLGDRTTNCHLCFLAYLVLLLSNGSLTFKFDQIIVDFVLAGRRLGPWLVSISETPPL